MNKKRTVTLILLLVVFAAGFASILIDHQNRMNQEPEMLNLLPGDSYEADWQRVDSLEQEGLPKSALELVQNIYKKAKNEKNDPQLVKCTIYTMKFTYAVEEEALVKNLEHLKAEVAAAEMPLKPVLQSMLGQHYWNYYQQNRWRFANRSETEQVDEADVRTWDLRKIITAATEQYLASLENADSLRRVPIDYYQDVLDREKGSAIYRPTLYDLLAHRALEIFENDELGLTKPAYRFELNGEAVFGTDADFLNVRYESRDSMSFKLQAARILQDLTRMHLKDADPAARTFVAMKRLRFARRHSTVDYRDSLYIGALDRLEETVNNHEVSAWVAFDRARYHETLAGSYNGSQSDAHKNEKTIARDIANAAIQRFPDSQGARNCKVLLERLGYKSLHVITEKITMPDQVFRALLSFKNMETAYARVVPVSESLRREIENLDTEKRLAKLKSIAPTKAWKVELPKDADMNEHKVEIAVPALPKGYYALLLGSAEDLTWEKQGLAYHYFWVSEMAYSSRNLPGNKLEFFVFNRETGEPLKGATAQSYIREYNYNKRKYIYNKGPVYSTAADGSFIVPPLKNDSRSFYLEFRHGADVLRTDDTWYQYRDYRDVERRTYQTVFFTDRGIYRPGQTIYFKGIVLEKFKDETKIAPNMSTTVEFYDVNHQKVSELNLRTNEYGTFNGTFTAPQGLLNGQMHIRDTHGSVYFSVEDYKRPKFEVAFEPVSGSFKLGEKVKVSGKAEAYAGSSIDGAEVNYRVVRTASFPYWSYRWWRIATPSSPAMEIVHGETTTNEKGEFEIEFTAIPDGSIAEKLKPQFNYTVYADVVDITGETHSSSVGVNVGYVALSADLRMGSEVEKGYEKGFKIVTNNLNGQFEAAKGSITIHKLKAPERTFRARLWEMPDKFLMTQAVYYQQFPNDIYKNENDRRTWETGAKVFEENFDSKQEDTLHLKDKSKWESGYYKLVLKTRDKFGAEVEVVKFFALYAESDKTLPIPMTDWLVARKLSGEPGETAKFSFGSSFSKNWVLYEVEHKGELVQREWLRIDAARRSFELPIQEKHRGNFAFYLSMVRHGRMYTHARNIYVPWSNKELKIEYETFRDKLQPGEKEQWKLRISGPNGEKMAAEMVAGMYDASLDVFRSISWGLNVNPTYYTQRSWRGGSAFSTVGSSLHQYQWNVSGSYRFQEFDRLNWFDYPINRLAGYYRNRRYKRSSAANGTTGAVLREEAEEMDAAADMPMSAAPAQDGDDFFADEGGAEKKEAQTETTAIGGKKDKDKEGLSSGEEGKDADLGDVKVRTNLNETAFFYPDLRTNEKGEIEIAFTVPEALTRWNILGLAHTKDLDIGYVRKSLVTQKELMVMPNPPRFFRENDRITFTAKVSNLSEKDLSGTAQLELFDALTMQPIDTRLGNNNAQQPFTVKKGQSAPLAWTLKIPSTLQAVTWRVKAKAGNFTDGEEQSLPVLTNSMLVTETMPLPVRPKQNRVFTFDKLLNNQSTTLRHHKLTLEFTSNPAWYAVQALPYLMEYPYECTEQVFSRYYANSLASHIANSHPRIKRVFDAWKTRDKEALLSNLEKNQELKYLLLEETPWVLQAQDESERKKRVGLLFDLNKMGNELARAMKKLQKAQVSNGGWPWFPGMPESRYITQHVVTGMGHLDHLDVETVRTDTDTWNMLRKAVKYLDTRIREDYEDLIRYKVDLDKNNLGRTQIQYLYARSYFLDIPIDKRNQKAFDYYTGQAREYWLDFNKYLQGMIALGLHRQNKREVPMKIVASLKEHALQDDEMGMYWKDNRAGWYWYQAPIETQALLIEAFDEVAGDMASVEEMKLWLLKQKQTQDWKTTKATVEACYALLLRGTDYLAESEIAEIKMGGQLIDPLSDPETKVEAGTGYFKMSWSGSDVKADMGKVEVTNKNDVAAWGAVYWQYFEQLDKITFAETNIKLAKELFLEQNTDAGPKLTPITKSDKLKPGDKLKVRILLESDRDMEYVHMKDMRAAGFEPINTISRYKWQDGLGYYESTRDAATNFFFHWLPKGKYVFEYPLRVTHKGDFSNGITTIQCMYAPEFTAHSEGVRVAVD